MMPSPSRSGTRAAITHQRRVRRSVATTCARAQAISPWTIGLKTTSPSFPRLEPDSQCPTELRSPHENHRCRDPACRWRLTRLDLLALGRGRPFRCTWAIWDGRLELEEIAQPLRSAKREKSAGTEIRSYLTYDSAKRG